MSIFTRRKLPLILQSEIAECGLACLAMIAGFYGWKIKLSDLRRKIKSSLKGLSVARLKIIAADIGLSVKIMRLEINQIQTVKLPCIFHWDLNHFIVVHKITNNHIVAYDPARGIRVILFEELNFSFTGIALEIIPNHNFKIDGTKNSAKLTLSHFIKTYQALFLKLFLVSSLIQITYIAGVKITQICIDTSAHLFRYPMLSGFLIVFLGLKLMETGITATRSLIISSASLLINKKFSAQLIEHLLSLPMAFFENRHLGDLLSRFSTIEKIKNVLTEGLIEGLVDGLFSLLMIIVILLTCYPFGIILLFTASIYTCLRWYYNNKYHHFQNEIIHTRSMELSNLMETIRAIPSIKIFGKETNRITTWSRHFYRSLNTTISLARLKIFCDATKNILLALDFMITLGLGCFYMNTLKITLGTFYALLAYRLQFTSSVISLADKSQEYRALKLHIDRLDDIISEVSELSTNKMTPIASHNMVIKNISYAYPFDSQPTLKNINFEISENEYIVITGPSGCGKTTLLKIMMGLLAPTTGNIFIDNIPIYPDHIASYRKNIAGIFQDDSLLSGSIAENISFFTQPIDYLHLQNCAKLAGIIEEINALPMQFNTLIGDMGSTFSGGQKQRLLLARALYSRPKILFLDEATSHLDAKKELEVNQALRSLGITVIMIAHREETIAMADRIITIIN